MASSIDAELRTMLRELLPNDERLQHELLTRLRTLKWRRAQEVHVLELDDYRLNKWGYAFIGALIGLLSTAKPGGLTQLQGFGLGFVLVYAALSWLELTVQHRVKKQRQNVDEQL